MPDPIVNPAQVIRDLKQSVIDEPAARLIGEPLCPVKSWLVDLAYAEPNLIGTETYPRSLKSALIHIVPNASRAILPYTHNEFKNGGQAHIGNISNVLQTLGDRYSERIKNENTTPGQSDLYDRLLQSKLATCTRIKTRVSQNLNNRTFLRVNFHNDYPCIMVNITKLGIRNAPGGKAPSAAAFENWVDFVGSLYIGLVNHAVYQRKLPIEITRRSGLGYLTTTLSATNSSFRINVGIIPDCYADILADQLVILADILRSLSINQTPVPAISPTSFFLQPDYKNYLGEKYKTQNPRDIVQLLWVQGEKTGKTLVQNIMRTPYAHQGISVILYNYMVSNINATPLAAVFAAIHWATSRLGMHGKTLSFNQNQPLGLINSFNDDPAIDDPNYWDIIQTIIDRLNEQPYLQECQELKNLEYFVNKRRIRHIPALMQLVNEHIFTYAIETKLDDNDDDGYGSDSDTESVGNDRNLFHRKIITHNGMRAIIAALIAAADHLAQSNSRATVYLEQSYYEVPYAADLFRHLPLIPQVTVVKRLTEANIVLFDMNACVTDDVAYPFDPVMRQKILIFDNTFSQCEASYDEVMEYIDARPALMFMVDSGLKEQQLGADKNHYGTIRIFAHTREIMERTYNYIKQTEPPLDSPTSHRLRRLMKEIGTVPTAQSYFGYL